MNALFVDHPRAMMPATLIRRYKRFLAEVELPSGDRLTVHCPNSGAMLGCAAPGQEVRISDSGNPVRRLQHTLELVRVGRAWVGVNTMLPNHLAEHFVRHRAIPELAGYTSCRREVAYGR